MEDTNSEFNNTRLWAYVASKKTGDLDGSRGPFLSPKNEKSWRPLTKYRPWKRFEIYRIPFHDLGYCLCTF